MKGRGSLLSSRIYRFILSVKSGEGFGVGNIYFLILKVKVAECMDFFIS